MVTTTKRDEYYEMLIPVDLNVFVNCNATFHMMVTGHHFNHYINEHPQFLFYIFTHFSVQLSTLCCLNAVNGLIGLYLITVTFIVISPIR